MMFLFEFIIKSANGFPVAISRYSRQLRGEGTFYTIVEITQLAFTQRKLYLRCQYRQLWLLPSIKAFIDSDRVWRNEDGTMYFD